MKENFPYRISSLPKKLFFSLLILKFTISPISPSELDYMYELGDGVLDEGGFEFGDTFGRMTSFQTHNRGPNSSGILTFDIGIDKAKSGNIQNGAVTTSGQDAGSDGSQSSVEDLDNVKEKFVSKLSWVGDYTFGTLLIIFGFLSLLGNGCILLVFCFRHRRLSPAEVFLVNLGVVDILLAIASYPMSMIASFKHGWQFGELGCTVYAFVCYFLGVASIFSITSIALIRYLKTCTPVLGNRITCWTSFKMIAWGYVISLIWALLPLFGFGNYGPEPFGLSCTLDWVAKDKASRAYIVLVTVFCVFLPLFLIIFSYTQIIVLVKQSDSLVRSNGVNKRNMTSDIQLTWISGLVTLGFIIGWMPYTIVSLWASYQGEIVIPMWATPIPVLMAKSSIAYNPLIYIFFTARYREDFKSLLQHWLHIHFKANEQNNNGNVTRRANSARTHNKDLNNENAEDNSPRNSASSTMTTRQFTTTSTPIHITNNNMARLYLSEIPLQTLDNEEDEKKPNHNNNGHDLDNSNLENEYSQDEEDNADENEKDIIMVREQNGINQSIAHPPSSHVVTMFTGNGVSTVVSSSNSFKSTSTARKLLAASSSLFSLRSGISRSDEEQQV